MAYATNAGGSSQASDLTREAIEAKRYCGGSTVLKKNDSDDTVLRVANSPQMRHAKTAVYVKNITDNHCGAVRFTQLEPPMALIAVAKNSVDLLVPLKPLWAWEIAAFDLLIHASGYLAASTDGILPIAYYANSPRLLVLLPRIILNRVTHLVRNHF